MEEIIPQTKIESPLLEPFLERLKKEGPASWGSVFAEIEDQLNVETRYTQESSASFEEMRQQLNTEPGVLIANHPSILDQCFVFPPLDRSDLLVMAERKRFPFFEETFGSENVVCTPLGVRELNNAFQRVKEHISSGGLFVHFPSGGEEMSTGEVAFKSGFRSAISEMRPQDMVYSFYIDPEAGQTIMDEMVGPPSGSSDTPMLFAPQLHIRPREERLQVKVNESYSKAEEWQEIIGDARDSSSAKQNQLLTKHFLDKVAF